MRKMRFALILVAVVMLVLTAMSCGKKPTEPTVTPGEMVLVPGGTFTMGDTRNVGLYGALPAHTVTLNSFYIGKYEVTQGEYSKYMQPAQEWTSEYGLGDTYPAYGVSWYAAIKYCNLRSMAEGLTPCYKILDSTNPVHWGEVPNTFDDTWDSATCNWKAGGYRLPTEAEWEYAARGRTNDPDYLYSGSENINAVAWYYGNSGGTSHPVGTKAPNGINLYDMSGNVVEWCWNWEDFEPSGTDPQTDPTGPDNGYLRIQRGGDWECDDSGPEYCSISTRRFVHQQRAHFTYGFRLCRSKID
ncbi:MAG: formylglycine-generating enzyme family protein [Candidatus Cloacimonadaceae bacterium]|jgi:sulfatase modifying factor 1